MLQVSISLDLTWQLNQAGQSSDEPGRFVDIKSETDFGWFSSQFDPFIRQFYPKTKQAATMEIQSRVKYEVYNLPDSPINHRR